MALAACGPAGTDAPETPEEMEARARAIHERVITADTHDDISPANFTAERNYTMDLPTQVNLPKMKAGGLDVAWFVVYVGQEELTEEGFAQPTPTPSRSSRRSTASPRRSPRRKSNWPSPPRTYAASPGRGRRWP